MPQFEYKSDKQTLTAQNFMGHWTLLSFWSSTCPPCLAELPSLNQLALDWEDPSFDIMTVNVDKENSTEQDTAKDFLNDEDLSLPTVFDGAGILQKAFQVSAYPTHFLINPQGEIVWQQSRAFTWSEQVTKDELAKLTEQPAPEQEESQSQDPNSPE